MQSVPDQPPFTQGQFARLQTSTNLLRCAAEAMVLSAKAQGITNFPHDVDIAYNVIRNGSDRYKSTFQHHDPTVEKYVRERLEPVDYFTDYQLYAAGVERDQVNVAIVQRNRFYPDTSQDPEICTWAAGLHPDKHRAILYVYATGTDHWEGLAPTGVQAKDAAAKQAKDAANADIVKNNQKQHKEKDAPDLTQDLPPDSSNPPPPPPSDEQESSLPVEVSLTMRYVLRDDTYLNDIARNLGADLPTIFPLAPTSGAFKSMSSFLFYHHLLIIPRT